MNLDFNQNKFIVEPAKGDPFAAKLKRVNKSKMWEMEDRRVVKCVRATYYKLGTDLKSSLKCKTSSLGRQASTCNPFAFMVF
jgi:hypothetical protein